MLKSYFFAIYPFVTVGKEYYSFQACTMSQCAICIVIVSRKFAEAVKACEGSAGLKLGQNTMSCQFLFLYIDSFFVTSTFASSSNR